MVGGRLIGHNDPDHQELVVKFNELMANCAIYSTALDITDAANALAAEGHPPDTVPTTRLDLEPRALFPGGPAA